MSAKETTPEGTTVLHVTNAVISWPREYLLQVQPCLDPNMTVHSTQAWLRAKSAEVKASDPQFSWNLWWVASQLEGCGSFRFTGLEPERPKMTCNVDHTLCSFPRCMPCDEVRTGLYPCK